MAASVRQLFRLGLSLAVLLSLMAGACAPDIARPILNIPAAEQEVPAVLAIGPFDMSKVTYDGEPLDPTQEASVRYTFQELLQRPKVLGDVVVLNLPPAKSAALDAEAILALARTQRADLLLVGQVKEYEADTPVPVFGSRYRITMRAELQLYNVHTGERVWKKTESVTVARDGSSIAQRGSLDAIIRQVAMPSLATGLLPPLMRHLQTEQVASLKESHKSLHAAGTSGLFGGVELAKIDAELAPPATNVRTKPHAYAVIVGIEAYHDLPRVDYARRDAEMVKQYLIKSLGYREENIVMLLDDNATRSRVRARIEKWLPKQIAEHPDAEAFLYYAGHGAPDQNTNQAFLVPYDGDPSYLEETGYPLKQLYQLLGEVHAKQVTVVIDSCFSGAGGRSVIAKGARPMLIAVENPVLASTNLVVLSAASASQISSSFQEKRHGLFTYYFLKGLQGEADLNKDGVVEVQELYTYLKPQVEREARRMNQEQSPQLLPNQEMLGERAKLQLIDLKR